jgi:hypothetical protein
MEGLADSRVIDFHDCSACIRDSRSEDQRHDTEVVLYIIIGMYYIHLSFSNPRISILD